MHSPKRIIITRFPFESILSGEEWHTIHLAMALRDAGYDVSFVGNCSVLLQELSSRGFPTEKDICGHLPVSAKNLLLFTLELPFLLPYTWIRLLVRHLQKRIDVLYMLSLSEKILLTPLAKILGIKVLWVEHQRFGRWIQKNPYRHVYALLSKWVRIICVSDMYKKDLKNIRVPSASITVIPNGIDCSFFTPEVEPLFSSPTFSIGVIARLSEDKGIDVLLQACTSLPFSYSLHIMGTGPDQEKLHDLAVSLGIEKNVHWYTPYIDIPREKIPAFMKSMHTMVLPSSMFDPFGLVAAESMATGTPTIVSDVCGIATYLTHEKDAYIFPAKDATALASCLTTLQNSLGKAKDVGNEGRKTAEHLFDQKHMVAQYIDCIEKGK